MSGNKKVKHSANTNPKVKKQQSAFEFITTYGWAILILAIVIVMLYYFIGIPSTSVPNECKFIYGSNCQGIIATSLASSTKMTLVITNSQSYPIFNPLIKVATDSYGNLSAACLPANALVNPGSEIICNVTIPQKISPGTTITGTIYLNITACPSGNINNCQPEQLQTYKGNIITRVTSQSYNIHLTSTSTSSTSTSSTSTSSTSSTSTSTTSTSTSTSTVLCPPGSQSYTTAGTYQFTTPSGCGTSITYTISLVGGGGGGASQQMLFCNIQQTAPPYCGYAAGAGGGGGGYEVVTASGLAAGTQITINVGSGGETSCQVDSTTCHNPVGGVASYNGLSSNVIATNLEASAGGGGGGIEATQIYASVCSGNPPHASVGGSGGTNSYSGSAITSVTTNYVGSNGFDGPSAQCSNPGGAGGASGGNMGTGGAGAGATAAAQPGSPYGGGGGGGSGTIGSTGGGLDPAAGASGEVIISWN